MQLRDVINRLESLANPEAVKGMARFGINPAHTLGVSIPNLRKLAKEIGKDHTLAAQLWTNSVHEARILASMIDDPALVTEAQMDSWVNDFDSWDVCDQCCLNLFVRTRFAYQKAVEWSFSDKEYVKRAGFVLMAELAVTDKKAGDGQFEQFLPIIKSGASDGRNFVKKAVNWALRQIGKRSLYLNNRAIETAEEIGKMDAKSARWIASDAIRELVSEKVQERLKSRGANHD